MAKLFELVGEYVQIKQALEDGDFDAQTVADTLESASGDLEQKAVNVAKIILEMESEAEMLKAHAKHQAERAKSLESKADHMREYLLRNIKTAGITKISDLICPISVRESRAVIVPDASVVPEKYLLPPKPRDPNKAAIGGAIKSGEPLDFAHIEVRQYLKIG